MTEWPHRIEVMPPRFSQPIEEANQFREIIYWCMHHFGPPQGKNTPEGTWKTGVGPYRTGQNGRRKAFYFADDNAAVMFKMRWANDL